MNIRFWYWVPAAFVGLGILGTFYGLQKGITGFDTGSSETIQSSIKDLLAGTSTAFSSSLVGISASLLFHLLEKGAINRLVKRINNKAVDLDNKYLLTNSETQDIATKAKEKDHEFIITAINNKLDSLFVTRTKDNKEIKFINIISKISDDLDNQRASFQGFIDDFYTQLIGYFNDYSETSKERINEIIMSISTMNSSLGNFSNNTGKEIGDTVSIVIKELTEQLTSISTDFKETLQEGALKQINEVSELLSASAKIMEKTPQNIESVINTIQNTLLTELNDNITKFSDVLEISMSRYTSGIESMLNNIQESEAERYEKQQKYIDCNIEQQKEREESQSDSMGKIIATYAEINEEQIKQTTDVFSEALENYKNQFNEIITSYKAENNLIMQKNLELIKGIDKVVADTRENTDLNKESVIGFKNLISENTTLLSQFKSQISDFITITTNFKDVSKEFSNVNEVNLNVVAHITTVIEKAEAKFHQYIQSGDEILGMFKDVVYEEKANISSQLENYNELHSQVNNIFKSLNDGLIDYRKVTEENLNKGLQSFINNFETAVMGLSATVEELSSALEELPDTPLLKTLSGIRNV